MGRNQSLRDQAFKIADLAAVKLKPIELPLQSENVVTIQRAIATLLNLAETGCDCPGPSCNAEEPRCEAMIAKRDADDLQKMIDPEIRSLNPDRLSNPAEAIYVDAFKEKNTRHPAVNGGYSLLELLLSPTRPECRAQKIAWWDRTTHPAFIPVVSQRDAEVAATVIQWLGTACGGSFVRECERRIQKVQQSRVSVWPVLQDSNEPENDLIKTAGREIAAQFIRPDMEGFDQIAAAAGQMVKHYAELVAKQNREA